MFRIRNEIGPLWDEQERYIPTFAWTSILPSMEKRDAHSINTSCRAESGLSPRNRMGADKYPMVASVVRPEAVGHQGSPRNPRDLIRSWRWRGIPGDEFRWGVEDGRTESSRAARAVANVIIFWLVFVRGSFTFRKYSFALRYTKYTTTSQLPPPPSPERSRTQLWSQ